ncbi:MAG TPA: VOC family protein [Casimicrobiaceae bacterium]|jgi:catechol 2,3-dioxygenase-like lactoylglutathione lyase family enzyme|nr:VOC family protein [Casimicrobiaceae bacterium]
MVKPLQSSRDVIIQTDAWEEATRFYANTLGLPVVHRSPNLVGFETGAFCLYVERGPRPGPVFEFLVPDVAAAKERLVAAGCSVEEEDPSLPRCYLRDPFGLVFNLGRARSA